MGQAHDSLRKRRQPTQMTGLFNGNGLMDALGKVHHEASSSRLSAYHLYVAVETAVVAVMPCGKGADLLA